MVTEYLTALVVVLRHGHKFSDVSFMKRSLIPSAGVQAVLSDSLLTNGMWKKSRCVTSETWSLH